MSRGFLWRVALPISIGWFLGLYFMAEGTTGAEPAACPGFVLASGTVDAAPHQIAEGYIAIGEAVVMLRVDGVPFQHVQPLVNNGLVYELVVRPVKCRRGPEALER